MKTYKTIKLAMANSNGAPIIQIQNGVESLYVVGEFDSFTELQIISDQSSIAGQITIKWLTAVDNANRIISSFVKSEAQ